MYVSSSVVHRVCAQPMISIGAQVNYKKKKNSDKMEEIEDTL